MRIAVLVKQVPAFDEMKLDDNGRLVREGIELELNPYCRRAVAEAVILAGERSNTKVTVITLGPPSAEDSLREAIAWGLAHGVDVDGVLVSDPGFAGSDTIATAKAVVATLKHAGPFDLVLAGRNSVDADTGQVPAQVAALCSLPFLAGVRYLNLDGETVHARCEHDDGWMQAEVELPVVLSCAERLCDPAKVDPPERALVPADRIRRVTAAELGAGPWGDAASLTTVGATRFMEVVRARRAWAEEPVALQVENALTLLRERGAFDESDEATETVSELAHDAPPAFVLCEPGRATMTRELLGAAMGLTGNVVAVTLEAPDAATFGSWGANAVCFLEGENVEEDVARAVVDLATSRGATTILAGSTAWGREVASRIAAAFDCGLVGDAVDLEMDEPWGSLTAWKPAFGGQLIASIGYRSERRVATVRPGVLPLLQPRPTFPAVYVDTFPMEQRSRVRVLARTRDDDLDVLAQARAVVGVGQGVAPERYDALEPLCSLLGAELAATRKVTDKGFLPRSRQVGITGRAIAPRLFVSIGASGKFNHAIGIRAAQTVLAINPDASAPIFEHADAGIVAPWEEAVPLLVAALRAQLVVD